MTTSDPGSPKGPTVTMSGGDGACPIPTFKDAASPFGVAGPAVKNLTGGADRSTWSLDGGDFTVSPPAAGTHPVVSRTQAECAALASSNTSGFSFGYMAGMGGIAIGYGRVTISSKVKAPPATGVSSSDGIRNPTLPAPTTYDHRLAWIVVTNWGEPAACPSSVGTPASTAGSSTTATTKSGKSTWVTVPRKVYKPRAWPKSYDEQVWLVDAKTGLDALVYTEGRPPLCGLGGWQQPNRFVPYETDSLPWTLVSRHGTSVTVEASIFACQGQQYAGRTPDGDLRVTVEGPVAPNCGSAVATKLTTSWPAKEPLRHAQTGPVIGLSGDLSGSGTTTTGPTSTVTTVPPPVTTTTTPATESGVVQLTPADAQRTLHVRVGTVLIAPPLGTIVVREGVYRTSDPAVVALLNHNGNVVEPTMEFRAVAPGTATLSRPAIACGIVGPGQSKCPRPWWVKVIVT